MPDLERDLGPFEHLLWLTDQWTPRHFAVAARLRGRVDGPALREALRRAQRRHPALRAAIAADHGRCPRFVSCGPGAIPLRVRDRIVGDEWRTELLSELATPFETRLVPLVRAVLVRGSSVSELIVVVHHSVGDALAAAFVIRELVEDLAGNRMTRPLSARRSMEELLGLPHECVPTSGGDYRRARRATPQGPAFEAWESEPGASDELVDRCRRERTTVQGALTAAFTLALSESGGFAADGAVRCLSPISVRALCPPAGTDFGLYLTSAKTCHRPATATDLWELARATRDQVAAGLERERLMARVAGQQALLAKKPTPEAAYAAYRSTVEHQAVISNIGRYWANNGNGPVRLEALWLVPNVEEEPVVGVATVDRRMCVTLLGGDTVPGLLDNALSRLPLSAARTDFAPISSAHRR
jgi:Phthiocerol/phthiodiolone dimycocerosyl transferase C-terminus